MKLTLCEALTLRQDQTTTPGTLCPTLCHKCVGSLTPFANHVTLKMQEMGPMVCSPYPRRLERLTICSSWFFKGFFFYLLILLPCYGNCNRGFMLGS